MGLDLYSTQKNYLLLISTCICFHGILFTHRPVIDVLQYYLKVNPEGVIWFLLIKNAEYSESNYFKITLKMILDRHKQKYEKRLSVEQSQMLTPEKNERDYRYDATQKH